MRIIATAALVCLLAACSSGQGPARGPQGVAPYGQPSRTAPPTRTVQGARVGQARPAARSYAAAPSARGGSFRWHSRIGDAQAQARAEGKLILVGSTKPACGLCDKFKNQIVPGMGSQVSAVTVGYMVQAPTPGVNPEAPQIWAALRQNLRSEGLMPLVGVFSPDLRYLAGFGGPPDQAKLLRALGQARRMHPVSARVPAQPMPTRRVASTMVGAQVNEFGEYEWTPVPLFPVETIEPRALAQEAAAPEPAPDALPDDLPLAGPEPIVAEVAAPLSPEAWARAELERALGAIEAGQYDQARQMLETVMIQMPGTEAAREAARGGVALYNAQRISDAADDERRRLQAEAARNLGRSMWGSLFVG